MNRQISWQNLQGVHLLLRRILQEILRTSEDLYAGFPDLHIYQLIRLGVLAMYEDWLNEYRLPPFQFRASRPSFRRFRSLFSILQKRIDALSLWQSLCASQWERWASFGCVLGYYALFRQSLNRMVPTRSSKMLAWYCDGFRQVCVAEVGKPACPYMAGC